MHIFGRTRRRLSMLGVLCGMILLGGSASSAADEYAFLLRARGNPYWKAVTLGIQERAAALGVLATVQLMETEANAEEQINICNALIERRPKVLAIAAANTQTGLVCLKRAATRGILVAEIDSSIPVTDAEAAQVRLQFTVGSDNFRIGEQAAEYAARISQRPDPVVLILEGAPGSIPGKKRVDGFREKLLSVRPGAHITASLAADWERLKAAAVTTDILQRTPDLTLIYAANDVMALGAVEALKAAGRDGVAVIGVDGTADARSAVQSGRLTATVAQLPFLIGKRTLELAVEGNHDRTVREVTPALLLTKPVLEQNEEPLLQYVR